MTHQSPVSSTANFLQGGGEMGARMRAYDWSNTSLGAPEQWQQSLKTAVRILLTSRQPMWVWWGEDLINLYNDAYRPILGGKHPEMLGQPAAVVWREIWDEVGPRAESVMLKNEGTYDESLLLIMERNGYPEETYYTFSYSPIPDDQGGTGGIICANTDDTQRVIGERQLALLRELAAKTADARTFDEACTLSADCLNTNPYDLPFALIYLVNSDQQQVCLAGTSGIDRGHLLVPETVVLDQDSIWCFSEVIQSQQPAIVSDLVQSDLPTGAWQQAPHQAVVMPLGAKRHSEGTVASGEMGKAGILVVGLNPFRLFDDSYRGFLDLIAGQIAASISNAQAYEEERKRAEALAEIDRAKTVFFSNVSHEFRTPLTLMLSPLEELSNSLHERLRPDEREQLQLVQRNGLRLQKLVNTLLDFSRIEAGRVQATYEPIDLAAYTAELASVFRSAIEQSGMRLMIDCPPLPEQVYVDREMWEKIVLNLLSNAFKFTLEGEISVQLQWQNDQVKLTVQDTGIGIPAAELPYLFERFHRVKGAQGRSFEGSGIGLSLVQELVKLHHGTIEVASVEGEGTCFTIAIPTGMAHLPTDRISAPRTLASTALDANSYLEEALRWLPEVGIGQWAMGSGDTLSSPTSDSPLPTSSTARILLAEDNADMRDYVKRLLSQQYEVEAVADGMAALHSIHRSLPDLVLTDVMMPNLDGFELLQALRTDPETREVPIILLSARAGEEARIEGLAAGADDYLTKPFSAREMLTRVEATLKLAQLRRQTTQREQALRLEAEAVRARLESVLAGINEQFIVLDREWRYTFVNEQVTAITGKTQAELLGHCMWEVFPDAIGTPFEVAIRRAVVEKTFVQVELFYPPYQRWLESRIYPFADGVTIFVSDISDRKQIEEQVRESEKFLKGINETAPNLLYIFDLNERRNLYVSPQIFPMLGISPADVQAVDSQLLVQLFHPDDLEPIERHHDRIRAAQEDDIFTLEYRMKHSSGKWLWLSSRDTIFVRDDQGKPLQMLGSAIDITDRKQAELEREQLLVKEQAAREEAQAANRIKDEFLAVLSHELRSPLNPILGWAKLLKAGNLDAAKTAQAVATIERNAQLQSELIEDLLDVSRILQGKLSLNVSPIDLVSTIRSAIETVRLAAEAKSITVEARLDDEVGQVSGDATRLQQVVWNLLSNAVKFTPAGGRVEVRLEQVDNQAQITVSDNGKGILTTFLSHVFDYFRQEDGATTRKFGGLGLGLAIVRHLVELHGGTVRAESPGEGQGATFTVTIPLAAQSAAIAASDPSPASALDLSSLQILVVDDEPDSREFVVFVLEQAGAIVTSAASGLEALQQIEQVAFDLIVSDIGMPEMDGYQLMQHLRSLEQGRQMPAIALSAYAGEYNQRQAIQAGFHHHLSKPVEPEDLVSVINTICSKATNLR